MVGVRPADITKTIVNGGGGRHSGRAPINPSGTKAVGLYAYPRAQPLGELVFLCSRRCSSFSHCFLHITMCVLHSFFGFLALDPSFLFRCYENVWPPLCVTFMGSHVFHHRSTHKQAVPLHPSNCLIPLLVPHASCIGSTRFLSLSISSSPCSVVSSLSLSTPARLVSSAVQVSRWWVSHRNHWCLCKGSPAHVLVAFQMQTSNVPLHDARCLFAWR